MIGSVRGMLLERAARGANGSATGDVLVEVGGVGYRATVPTGTLANLGEPGSPVFLHTHLHVRDDALVLYGFATREERVCFEALLGAHGVGPALALSILSALSPAALRRALADDDVDALTLVPGVGRKTAARLLMELKSRLGVPEEADDVGTAPAAAARGDLRAALAGLGYGPDEVRDVVRSLPEDGPLEDLLRQALRRLGASR